MLARIEGQDIEASHRVRDPSEYIKDSDAYDYEKGIHIRDDKSSDKKILI